MSPDPLPFPLGRKYAPDPRDRNFPMRAALPTASTRSWRYWFNRGWLGDQGMTSACVGFAWTAWLEDGPVTQTAGPPPIVDPLAIYAEAQKIDEWPGEDYDGTSVRAGAKALQARGFIRSYLWASSVEEIVLALLERGPVVVGTVWKMGMFFPDFLGFLDVSGPVVGGHAYVLNGINVETGVVRLKNSWGAWGNQGHALLRLPDFAALFNDEGEACLAVEVKNPGL